MELKVKEWPKIDVQENLILNIKSIFRWSYKYIAKFICVKTWKIAPKIPKSLWNVSKNI